jgi:hypothetical protein
MLFNSLAFAMLVAITFVVYCLPFMRPHQPIVPEIAKLLLPSAG